VSVSRLPLPDPVAVHLAGLEQALEEAGPEAVALVLPDVERLRARLWLQVHYSTAATATPLEGQDKLLTVKAAAERLGATTDWLYKHARELPFAVRLGPGQLRFSSRGIDLYIARRRGK
jgi:predicted DNA-binding transcriptional regulator AlpA